jgi:anti-anti-sigma factor
MTEQNYITGVEFYKGVTIVRLNGGFVGQTLPSVQKEFSSKTRHISVKNILFDLSGVADVDMAGIAGLVGLFRHMKKQRSGDRIGLVNVSAKVKALLEISGTESLFESFLTEEHGIKELQ